MLVLWRLSKAGANGEHTRALKALMVGSALAAIPGCAGMIGGRVLVLAGVGAAALLGVLLNGLWGALHHPGAPRGPHRWLLWKGLALFALLHGLGGPVVRLAILTTFMRVSREQAQMMTEAELACPASGPGYLLHAPDPAVSMYGATLLALAEPPPLTRLYVLSMAPGAHQLTRSEAQLFRLEATEQGFLRSGFEQVYRAPDLPLQADHNVALGDDALVRVEHTDSAGLPRRISLELRRDAPRCLVLWRDGALRSIPVPAIGESVTIRSSPGPMGM